MQVNLCDLSCWMNFILTMALGVLMWLTSLEELKLKLHLPKEQLTPVGTSATIGNGQGF